MNVLHLHLSDDDSFRVKSKKYPQLAPSDFPTYSHEEMKQIITEGKHGLLVIDIETFSLEIWNQSDSRHRCSRFYHMSTLQTNNIIE
jgi:hypothetical protein